MSLNKEYLLSLGKIHPELEQVLREGRLRDIADHPRFLRHRSLRRHWEMAKTLWRFEVACDT